MHNTLTEVAFYFGVNPTCQPTSVVGNKLGINFIGYTLYVYATCTCRINIFCCLYFWSMSIQSYYHLLGAESTSILIFTVNSPSCSAWHSLRNSSPFSSFTGLCLRYLHAEHGWLSSITYYQNKVTGTGSGSNIIGTMYVYMYACDTPSSPSWLASH